MGASLRPRNLGSPLRILRGGQFGRGQPQVKITEKLNLGQGCVALACLAVAVGMGAANAAGWLLAYPKAGWPLAIMAVGCEVIAVLVMASGASPERAPARFGVAILCAVLNVYGGHQFLTLASQGRYQEYRQSTDRRELLLADLQTARDCVDRVSRPSASKTRNAAAERLAERCRADQKAARAALDSLPLPETPVKHDPWIMWVLMVCVEAIKIFAVWSVTATGAAKTAPAPVVSISESASKLAQRRWRPLDQPQLAG